MTPYKRDGDPAVAGPLWVRLMSGSGLYLRILIDIYIVILLINNITMKNSDIRGGFPEK